MNKLLLFTTTYGKPMLLIFDLQTHIPNERKKIFSCNGQPDKENTDKKRALTE